MATGSRVCASVGSGECVQAPMPRRGPCAQEAVRAFRGAAPCPSKSSWRKLRRKTHLRARGEPERWCLRREDQLCRFPPRSSPRPGHRVDVPCLRQSSSARKLLERAPSEASEAFSCRVDESFNIRRNRTSVNYSGLVGQSGRHEARLATWRRSRSSKQGRRKLVTTEGDVNRQQSIASL